MIAKVVRRHSTFLFGVSLKLKNVEQHLLQKVKKFGENMFYDDLIANT